MNVIVMHFGAFEKKFFKLGFRTLKVSDTFPNGLSCHCMANLPMDISTLRTLKGTVET